MADIDRLIACNTFLRAANETDPNIFMPAMAEASDPKKTYLHTDRRGPSTAYDPSKLSLKNDNYDGKPSGALYGSEFWPEGKEEEHWDMERTWDEDEPYTEVKYASKSHSPWDDWTKDNISDDWIDANGITYRYTPQARVYTVKSDRDILNLPKKFWTPNVYKEAEARMKQKLLDRDSGYADPDEIAKEIQEGIENGTISEDDIAHVLNYEALAKEFDAIDFDDEYARTAGRNGSYIGANRYFVPILSAGQSILLNPDAITDVKPWVRPESSLTRVLKRMTPEERYEEYMREREKRQAERESEEEEEKEEDNGWDPFESLTPEYKLTGRKLMEIGQFTDRTKDMYDATAKMVLKNFYDGGTDVLRDLGYHTADVQKRLRFFNNSLGKAILSMLLDRPPTVVHNVTKKMITRHGFNDGYRRNDYL